MLNKSIIYFVTLVSSVTLIATAAKANTNSIIELQGQAKIKRNGASNYQPAFTGMTLILGDILFPDEKAVVRVLCSNNQIKKAQSGVPSGLNTICPGAKSTDPRGNNNIFLDLVRGDFIYQSWLLEDMPLLIWPKVEKLVKESNKIPVIHRMLGDIYVKLGRTKDAEERYEAALLFAQAENNFDEVAASKVGLAHVAVMNKNLSQAKELLKEAQMIYKSSGNNEQVNVIGGWLGKL